MGGSCVGVGREVFPVLTCLLGEVCWQLQKGCDSVNLFKCPYSSVIMTTEFLGDVGRSHVPWLGCSSVIVASRLRGVSGEFRGVLREDVITG